MYITYLVCVCVCVCHHTLPYRLSVCVIIDVTYHLIAHLSLSIRLQHKKKVDPIADAFGKILLGSVLCVCVCASHITYTLITLSSSYAIRTHKNKLYPIANAFSKCFWLSGCASASASTPGQYRILHIITKHVRKRICLLQEMWH